jgi:ectoine hydroxylase-related dioxygenase (phytanoyl-CoA dioxygenase family)
MPNNASCYQDRLGTNVAKTLKIKNVIFLLYYREVQVVAKAGSVLVQDSRLWHTGGVNTSDAVRTSVVVRYAPWWLSVEFGRTQVLCRQKRPFMLQADDFTKTGSGKT